MKLGWGGMVLTAALGMLVSGAATAEEVSDAWAGNVSLGLTNTTGNIDALALSFGSGVERKWEKDVVSARLTANFGRTSGATNIDNQALGGRWRHAFSDRFYVATNSEISRDMIQDIDLRFLANVGPGLRAWMGGEQKFLDLEAGFGYRHERFGSSPDRNSADARAAFEYRNLLFEKVTLIHTGEFLLPANETSDWLARTQIAFSLPVAGGWSFRTAFLLQYLNKPAVGNEELNTTLTTGLQYDF